MEHMVINEASGELKLLINPMWSALWEGFGPDYPMSNEDEAGIKWVIISEGTEFDPELYDHIVEAWKFHHLD